MQVFEKVSLCGVPEVLTFVDHEPSPGKPLGESFTCLLQRQRRL